MSVRGILAAAAGAILLAVSVGACTADRISSDCPSKSSIQNGASCSDDNLQCPFDVTQTACDGTVTTVSSSCICQSGAWSCPDNWQCSTDAGDDAGDDGSGGSIGQDGASPDGPTTD